MASRSFFEPCRSGLQWAISSLESNRRVVAGQYRDHPPEPETLRKDTTRLHLNPHSGHHACVASRLVVLGFVVSVVASLSVVAGPTHASSVAVALDCQAPIGFASKPPDSVTDIGGAVGLQTRASNRRAIQTSFRTDATVPDARYFAKTPLFVRTGETSAAIIVPREHIGRVALRWGNTDHDAIATRTFRVGPCPGPAPWIVFPGGYYLKKPGCIELIVRVSDRDHRVRMGVGSPCPGQRPPVEPSDS
jgi:hypothetical protein